jgi:indole-3-glycerol phosphate synthase
MNILDQIVETKKEEIRNLRTRYQIGHFTDSEYFNQPTMSLLNALRQSCNVSVIAEIKKASPSAGVIGTDFDPVKIAGIYEMNKASAISVLTDRNYFQGSCDYLRAVATVSHIPLLRKDFILDEYQVYEARAAGADAILLIAEILSVSQIIELTQTASSIGLDVLLELHSIEQLKKIDFNNNRLIGINNRNLTDLSVDPDTILRIKELLPSDVITVAESGIHEKSQIQKIKKAGINAILVGEYLLRAVDPGKVLHELKQWCNDAN